MLSLIVNRITLFFSVNKIIKEEDREIYAYGLELLLSTVFSLIAVVVISIIFGRFFETLVFLAIFILMRIFAGGYHASSHLRCFFILMFAYAVFLILLTYFDKSLYVWISNGFGLFSLGIIFWLSPVEDKNKPLSSKERKVFRLKSRVATVVCWIIIVFGSFLVPGNKFILTISFGMVIVAFSLIATALKNRIQHKAKHSVQILKRG